MDLVKRIRKIKDVIEKNETKINNETTTRYVLIDPVLHDLGWKLEDPNQVRYEEGTGGRWDYKLGDRLIIEAKKLGGIKLNDEKQLIAYLRNNGIQHGVLTDGNIWEKWDVSSYGENHDFVTKVKTSTINRCYA